MNYKREKNRTGEVGIFLVLSTTLAHRELAVFS